MLLSSAHAAGLRLTQQRMEIFGDLSARRDHPDVDTLFCAVRARLPKVSLFTVYRTLNAFERAGLVLRVTTWKGHARYDANIAPHAHFLCEHCGRVDDVDLNYFKALCRRGRAVVNGSVLGVEVMFHGVCAACAPGETRAEETDPSGVSAHPSTDV